MNELIAHALLHQVPIAIGVWDAEGATSPQDMRLIFMNEWGVKNIMSGYGVGREHVEGKTFREITSEQGREPNANFVQNLYETAQSQSPRQVELGTIFGRTYRMYFLPMGTRVAASMFEDITEMHDTNRRLSLALESAKAGMWWFDYVTDMQSWDAGAAQMLDLGAASTSSGTSLDLFYSKILPADVKDISALIDRALANPEVSNIELEFSLVKADGRTVVVMDRAQIYREDGKIVQMMHVLIDVNDKVQLTKKLQQSNSDLKNFAHVASHDLREPLRVISNYTQLLFEEYGQLFEGQPEAMQYRSFIQDASKRAMSLVEDLLRFSRAGNNMNPQENVSLTRLVRIAMENLRVSIDEARADIKIDNLPSVTCDAGMMVQVFQNLLSNAVKFTSKGESGAYPHIRVTASDHGRMWLIQVRDDGLGIEPEFLTKIFTPFYRLYTTAEYDGTGIGLSLCQRIVRAHGGDIWAESGGKGQGTTLSFTLTKA
jgi:signal transduction histidine kinase